MTHTEFMGDIFEVNVGKSGTDGKILKRILSQLGVMLSKHNKVVVARIDFHQPHYTANNSHLNGVLQTFSNYVKRHYGVSRVGYCWVREQERAKAQHYHLALMFDGNRIKHPRKLLEHIGEKWAFYTDGTFHIPKAPIHRLTRDNGEAISKAVYHLSYLAKGRGKGYKPPKTRDFSTSQLKPKAEQKK